MNIITETAPAKVNLTLDVIARRPDGYHEVKMVMQSISLADVLTFSPAEKISLTCTDRTLPTDERNLAYKAAKAILAGTGRGVAITLQKNIPLEAGLAGGSSDAAAVLRGVDKLYKLKKTELELLEIATKLGADVSFCLRGGTALAEGIGEKLTPLPSLPKFWLVLVKPAYGVSTALVYNTLDLQNIYAHPNTEAMLLAIQNSDCNSIIKNLGNVLEEVTLKLKPELRDIKNKLLDTGAENVLMSGSGPTVFGIFQSEKDARTAARDLQVQASVFITHTL